MKASRLLRAGALAAGGLVLAACGIPADAGPRSLNVNNVPFGLLAPTTSTTVPPPAADAVTVEVFVLGPAGPLVPVQRQIPAPVTLDRVLQALLAAPNVGELAAGYQSLISTETKLLGAQVVDGVARVDVSREFVEASGSEQILALAQIVYTATGVPGVGAVTFSLEGNPKEVPIQDGTTTTRPVTRIDYARLAQQ